MAVLSVGKGGAHIWGSWGAKHAFDLRGQDITATLDAWEVTPRFPREHLSKDTFRLADFSVQQAGGTAACFVRAPTEHTAFFDAFFARTGHQYTRFNYLGEWHSHPSFPAVPSTTDVIAMQEIVEDSGPGVNFALLLVVNLNRRHRVCLSATAFQADMAPVEIELVIEGLVSAAGWLRRLWPSRAHQTTSRPSA